MIDSVFLIESVREKHRRAPLFAERERYLRYLFEIGIRRERVRNVATMLLHVVRLLKLDSSRPVGMDEILRGCERWVDDYKCSSTPQVGRGVLIYISVGSDQLASISRVPHRNSQTGASIWRHLIRVSERHAFTARPGF